MKFPRVAAKMVGPGKIEICIYKINKGVATLFVDTFDLSDGFPTKLVRNFTDHCQASFDEVERLLK